MASGLQAGMTGSGTLHGDINIGGMSVSGADINNDFKSPGYDPKFGDSFGFLVGAQGGYLSPYGFYFDLGIDVGPTRTLTNNQSTTLFGFPYTVEEKMEFTQYRVTAIPGFMLPLGPKLFFAGQIGLGYSMVNGVYTNKTTWISTTEGGYTLKGSGFDYVPELRLHYLLQPRLAVGLAVGWNGSKFTELNYCCGTGGYSSATFPPKALNAKGENMTIDHTGIYGKLVITTFLSDLVSSGSAEAAGQAPAGADASASNAGAAAPSGDAATHLADGNKAYQAKDYAGAEDHYRQATQLDPQNAKAWQSLGNALLYQKKKTEALQAYDQALTLDPSNASLKKYVDGIR
jgi:hypothetical protein